MGKIVRLKELVLELKTRNPNEKVGFASGCFDLPHNGHVNLFRFAKNHVDTLIIAIDNDLSIRRSKGKTRPIHTQEARAKILSEFISIDYVLLLENSYNFSTSRANKYYDKIIKNLKPNYLITNIEADKYWEIKKNRIEAVNGSLLLFDDVRENSTTAIIEKIVGLHSANSQNTI